MGAIADRLEPMMVFPQRHQLPEDANKDWGWCWLADLLIAVRNVAKIHGNPIVVNHQDDLIRKFAVLANLQTVSEGRFFFFRFGTEIEDPLTSGVFTFAQLQTEKSLPFNIFVPEGWAKAVIEAVTKGAKEVYLARLERPGTPVVNTILAVRTGEKGDEMFQI